MGQKRKSCHTAAQGQTARITHENLGRMTIEEQKAQAGTGEAQSKAAHIQHTLHVGNKGVSQGYGNADKGYQAIQAIRQIDRIGGTHQ